MNSFTTFIENISQDFIPVIDTKFSKNTYVPIDLSKDNESLATIDVSSSSDFEKYIHSHLSVHTASVAYGGYNEARAIYRRSEHFNQQDPKTERNIHLGLDLWCDAGTSILVPVAGKIHSFKNNNNFGDYGPTIILEHTLEDVTFYTLYGHLSIDSLQGIRIGDQYDKGQLLAQLGDASVNGDYAPHLHFQIIKDLQDNIGDYPGVANQITIQDYLQNCPDPNLLLKI